MTEETQVYVIAHKRQEYSELTNDWYTDIPRYYKIGISNNVEKRLSILSGGTPHKLELVTTVDVDDAQSVESHLHQIVGQHQPDRGEWFRLHSNLLNSLNALDELRSDVIKQVRYNYARLDRYVSLYVAVHKARNGELPTIKELVV